MTNPMGVLSKLNNDVWRHDLLPILTLPEVGLLSRCSKTFHTLIKTLVENNPSLFARWMDNTRTPWAYRRIQKFRAHERLFSFYREVFLSIFSPNELSRMLPQKLRDLVLDEMMRQQPRKELCNGDALLEAAAIDHLEIIDMILPCSALTDEDRGQALIKACRQGNAQAAWRILEDDRGMYYHDKKQALFLAGKNGHLNIIRFLSSFPRIRAHLPMDEALAGAALSGSVTAVKETIDESLLLLRAGEFLTGMTALQDACIAGNKDVIEELLTNSHLRISPHSIDRVLENLFFRGHIKGCLDLLNEIDLTRTETRPLCFLLTGLLFVYLSPIYLLIVSLNSLIGGVQLIHSHRTLQTFDPIIFLDFLMLSVPLCGTYVSYVILRARFERNSEWTRKNELSLKERVKYVLIPNPQDLIALPIVLARITPELAHRSLCAIAHRFSALSPTKVALTSILGFIFTLGLCIALEPTGHQPEADFNAIN